MGGGDLSDLSNMGGSSPDGPLIPPRQPRSPGVALFVVGMLATVAVVAGIFVVWSGDDTSDTPEVVTAPTPEPPEQEPATPVEGATGEPSQTTATEPPPPPPPADDLFGGDLPAVLDQVLAAAGGPSQLFELAVYPDYLFTAFRDPNQLDNIDRRIWRDGEVGPPEPNPIDDRVDADTTPSLFALSEVDLSRLPGLVADAATRYDRPVSVTHVVINRFLPFDERVLVRVYASPTDGRSGGGYVSYDTAGTMVRVCC